MAKPINKIIKSLIISDFFLNSAWGLLSPVFALFIINNITSGNSSEAAKVAGFAALVYWGVKSFLQIPIGKYLDVNHGEKDDFLFMVLGIFLGALVPLGFLFASQPWHIYSFQILHALGMALLVPSWNAIFTRHIDKGREAFEWSVDSTSLGFGMGATGAFGGMIAAFLGFKMIFVLVSVLNLISVFCLLLIRKKIKNEKPRTG